MSTQSTTSTQSTMSTQSTTSTTSTLTAPLLNRLDPPGSVGLDKSLCAFSAADAQNQCAMLSLEAHVEVKERATLALLKNPFSQQLKGLLVVRKFKLISVCQFPHSRSH